jgi:hypothetical protein
MDDVNTENMKRMMSMTNDEFGENDKNDGDDDEQKVLAGTKATSLRSCGSHKNACHPS